MPIKFGKAKSANTSSKPVTGFMKKGQAAKALMDKEEELQRQRAAERGKMFRFWLPKDGETYITFLDGDLTEDGFLDVPMYYEHQVLMNGNWKNFYPCLKNLGPDEDCPICDTPAPGGSSNYYATLVAAFTILDHTEWEDKEGKIHKDEKKLFIAKRETVALLTKKAKKYGGLRYITFEVSRIGERAPNVGSDFELEKQWEAKELEDQFGDISPANYEEEITMLTAEELQKLGFGGSGMGMSPTTSKYEDEL